MIHFKTLTMRNFMSYGNNTTIVQLDNPGTVLILGRNADGSELGNGSNGVGKTTMASAISYVLYDKPLISIPKVDGLINFINKKEMIVTLEFDKGGKSYKIERARKMKGSESNFCKLWIKEGDEYKDMSRSSKETNADIQKIMGVPHELFCQIITYSAMRQPFLDLPTTKQVEAIEELFNITELSDRADEIKRVVNKELKPKLSELQLEMSHREREVEKHNNLLETTTTSLENWEGNCADKIQSISSELDEARNEFKDVDVEAEQALHAEIDEMKTQIAEKNNILENKVAEQGRTSKRVKELMSEQDTLSSNMCPYCSQSYADAKKKLVEVEAELDELTEVLVQLKEENKVASDEVDTLAEKYAELLSERKVQNIQKLLQAQSKITILEDRLHEAEESAKVNPYIEQLDNLNQYEVGELDYTEIKNVEREIEHRQFLVKLLTKKDSFVRKAVIAKNLNILNQRIGIYVAELGLPYTITFNSDLTADIKRFERPLHFGNLSNGQRARLNIALSFAFRDVLQTLHTPFNICLYDEVLDVGLDGVGIAAAAKIIKKVSREQKTTSYVISHREELHNTFDRTLTVEMENGFSYIRET